MAQGEGRRGSNRSPNVWNHGGLAWGNSDMTGSGGGALDLCAPGYHSPQDFSQLLIFDRGCSRTCSLGQKVLGGGEGTVLLSCLFQVEATWLKMYDSSNDLPSASSCSTLSRFSPPAHKTFQLLVLLPFALPSAHPAGCQAMRCAEVLQKYGFCHLCHPRNRWTR